MRVHQSEQSHHGWLFLMLSQYLLLYTLWFKAWIKWRRECLKVSVLNASNKEYTGLQMELKNSPICHKSSCFGRILRRWASCVNMATESSDWRTGGWTRSQSRHSFNTMSNSSFTRFVKKWWRVCMPLSRGNSEKKINVENTIDFSGNYITTSHAGGVSDPRYLWHFIVWLHSITWMNVIAISETSIKGMHDLIVSKYTYCTQWELKM